jgi:D-alanine-D-alanine ligase
MRPNPEQTPLVSEDKLGRRSQGMPDSRIGVLYGGVTPEREVSLASGNLVLGELAAQGFKPVRLLVDGNPVPGVLGSGAERFVIALHGGWGEDGRIQSLLELCGFQYSGSRPLPSAIAMNKVISKRLFVSARIPTPRWVVVNSVDQAKQALGDLPLPWVAKPLAEGSSVGVTLLSEFDVEALGALLANHDQLLIEEYIEGLILTVPVLDVSGSETVVRPLQIVPTESPVYDRRAKSEGLRVYNPAPDVPDTDLMSISDVALRAHHDLGCSGITRVDLVYSRVRGPFVLEVNTIPGMGPTGNLVTACSANGINRRDLVRLLLKTIR